MTGQRLTSLTLARRNIKKSSFWVFTQLSAQAWSVNMGSKVPGSRSLHLEDLFKKEAEENPSQTLVEELPCCGTGCSSSLKINPGTALSSHTGKTLTQLIIQFLPDTERCFTKRTVKLKAMNHTPHLCKGCLTATYTKAASFPEKSDQQITP